jgi:glutamyl-tRNA synthetase
LTDVVQAAGDRIKVAGDILEFTEFFVADHAFEYDEAAFEKRIRKPGVDELITQISAELSELEPFDAKTTDTCVHQFVEKQGIKIGDIIHILRVAITGKPVGLGMFDAMAILGRASCLARLERARKKAA